MTTLASTTAWTNRPPWKIFVSQVIHLAQANLKTRYRKTWAGFLWVVMNPLIMYGVQTYIFSRVLKLNVDNYSMYLLSGLLPWLYIVQSLEMSTSMFVTSGQLLKSFPAHPLVYLIAQLMDNFFNFTAAFSILFIALALNSPPTIYALLLPIPLVILMVFIFSFAWLLATIHVFFRDTRFMVTFMLNVSFFLTPIFYTTHAVPEEYRWMVVFNPFYIMIRPFRVVLYQFDWPSFMMGIAQSATLAGALLGVAYLYWRKKKNDLYFNV